jgi:NAD-dependent DNA ligase
MSVFSAFRSALPDRDPDGQASSPRYRGAAVADRDIDELIGIVKGVMADGHVVDDEARFLLDWMQTHANVSNVWPVNVLYPRILAAMKDEHVDPAEEMALLGMLRQAIGKNGPMQGEASMSTALPLCNPAPEIHFEDRAFCFTGAFYSGTRNWCEQQVIARGGANVGVSKKLAYLVIGEIGGRDWIHSTHGRKIEKAVELRDTGAPLAIVAEKHWTGFLGL